MSTPRLSTSAAPRAPGITHPGFTHLQFEALLTAARESANPCDFALVAMLGLLGLRIFEATGTDIADLGEEHGHQVLRACGTGAKIVQIPLPPAQVPGGCTCWRARYRPKAASTARAMYAESLGTSETGFR